MRLKANVIGPWGLAALVIGVTSPAIGLFAMWGPIEATAGPVVPLVFLGALAIILPTVLSYASLNRHAPSAGAAVSIKTTIVLMLVEICVDEGVFRYSAMSAFDAVDGSPPSRQPIGVGKMEESHGVCGDNRIGPWEVSFSSAWR